MDLSVVIITRNEEANLANCLRALPQGCEVIVVDSHSIDNTRAIAEAFQARVFERKFTNYAEQKNFACEQATRTWILSLDADEVLSPDLATAIIAKIQDSPENIIGYNLRRRLHFMGRELRFGRSTDWPIRLFRRGHTQFVGTIHEKLDVSPSALAKISTGILQHRSYHNLHDYFERFNRYTTLIADNKKTSRLNFAFYLNLYFRFWLEFFTRYIMKLGFLDGHPGYCYALISSMYTYIKYAKRLEWSADEAK